MTETSQHFQVDLRGVVDLLSRHIYSSPRVFLRELMQNAVDAITARREVDGAGGTVRISPLTSTDGEFVIRDDGVGLTADEVTELLATVGRSSKRDIFDLPRDDYLGQFGIGLLSCFLVSDEIVIRSRSARGGDPVQWIGRTDGTFTIDVGPADTPVGTSVHLRPRFDTDELLRPPAVLRLAETFGEFLPVTVSVDLATGGETSITHTSPFTDPLADPNAAHAYGTALLGTAPFAMIPLVSAGTGTRGTAYVLPYAPAPGRAAGARVYLGRMLLAESVDDLLPEWAFFVRAVVDSTGLSPTAGRESLVADSALEHTREDFASAIRRWVLDLGLTAPHHLAQFVAIHEVALKSLVRHDEELARFITRWLSVETTHGRIALGDLATRSGRVRYATSVDEFRQLAGIADPREPLVNGGYLYDAELVEMLPTLYPGLLVERVDVMSEFERLDPPPLDDRGAALRLEERATRVLESLECTAIVRRIDHPDPPALYVADPAALRHLDRGRTLGASGSLWASVLGTVDAQARQRGDADSARLCLNWANPVVRALADVSDDDVLTRTIHLLYGQALLAGHRPLAERDRAVMTDALSALIRLSVTAPAAPSADGEETP